jgi:hypothetical protein
MIESAIITEIVATTAVASSFVISMLVGMAQNVLFSLIGMMQMYVYLPLLDITFPGNIRTFLQFFMGLASCDLFTNEEVFTNVFFFTPTVGLEPYNDNFENLGLDSASMVYNLGDLAVIQFYLLFLILFLLIAKMCKKPKYVKRYSDALFWNFPLRYVISGYIELCFGSLIKFYDESYVFDTKSDATDTVLSCFYLGIIVLLPLGILILTNTKNETIKKKGPFYESV